jgi:hypothetical protein
MQGPHDFRCLRVDGFQGTQGCLLLWGAEAGFPQECADSLYRPIPIFSADLLQHLQAPDAHERIAVFESGHESRDGVVTRFHEPVNNRPPDVRHPRRSEARDEIVEVLPKVLPGEVAESGVGPPADRLDSAPKVANGRGDGVRYPSGDEGEGGADAIPEKRANLQRHVFPKDGPGDSHKRAASGPEVSVLTLHVREEIPLKPAHERHHDRILLPEGVREQAGVDGVPDELVNVPVWGIGILQMRGEGAVGEVRSPSLLPAVLSPRS